MMNDLENDPRDERFRANQAEYGGGADIEHETGNCDRHRILVDDQSKNDEEHSQTSSATAIDQSRQCDRLLLKFGQFPLVEHQSLALPFLHLLVECFV